jgi:hypothetical protein
MAAVTGPSSRPGGLGSARPGPAHRPRPGQPWGWPPVRPPRRGWPTTAPTRPPSTPASFTAAPSARPRWWSPSPGGAPTGQVFNPTPGFEVGPGPWSGVVPVRLRGRAGHRLEPGGAPALDPGPGRRSGPPGQLQGAGHRHHPDRQLPVRSRLPPRPHRRLRPGLGPGPAVGSVPRPQAPWRLWAVQHPAAGWAAVAGLGQAGRRPPGRGRRPGPGLGRCLQYQRPPAGSAGPPGSVARPRGGWCGPRAVGSAASAGRCWWGDFGDGRINAMTRGRVRSGGGWVMRTATRSRSRACGAGLWQRGHRRCDHLVVHRRHRPRGPRPVRRHPDNQLALAGVPEVGRPGAARPEAADHRREGTPLGMRLWLLEAIDEGRGKPGPAAPGQQSPGGSESRSRRRRRHQDHSGPLNRPALTVPNQPSRSFPRRPGCARPRPP